MVDKVGYISSLTEYRYFAIPYTIRPKSRWSAQHLLRMDYVLDHPIQSLAKLEMLQRMCLAWTWSHYDPDSLAGPPAVSWAGSTPVETGSYRSRFSWSSFALVWNEAILVPNLFQWRAIGSAGSRCRKHDLDHPTPNKDLVSKSLWTKYECLNYTALHNTTMNETQNFRTIKHSPNSALQDILNHRIKNPPCIISLAATLRWLFSSLDELYRVNPKAGDTSTMSRFVISGSFVAM